MLKTKARPRVERGVRLIERAPVSARMRVDRENGVIHGVKIVGHQSRWGYSYSPTALREAVPLYENKVVNIDHFVPKNPTDFRKVEEGFGEMRNVRAEPDGLYGDLHYIKSHPLAEMVAERAERFPHTLAMSHDALGDKVKDARGNVVVKKINRVKSVDLVYEGATTNSLFEAAPANRASSRPATRIVESSPARSDVPDTGASPEQKQAWLR